MVPGFRVPGARFGVPGFGSRFQVPPRTGWSESDAKPRTPNLEPNREPGTEPGTRHPEPAIEDSYFRIGFRFMYSALSVMLRNGS